LKPRIWVSCGMLPEQEVLRLAPEIERAGFDGITIPDHLFMPDVVPGAYPYTEDGQPPFRLDVPWNDVFVLAGAVAAVTTTLRVLTSVFILPLRHPLVVAKAAATAARLSGGRLNLGIGVGWQREEFDAVGVDFTKRGAMTDEMVEAMRALWQAGPVEHRGRFFSFGPLLMEPVPPRIPIVVGGNSDAAIRRAARLADGYLPSASSPEEIGVHVERMRTALREAGRDENDFELFAACYTPAEETRPLLDLEIGNIVVMPWPHPGKETTSVEEKLGYLERYAPGLFSVLR
jgi:probable F420-dependent oxidoreductase